MLFKDLHWRRGTPGRTGTYLVYDGARARVQVAVVTEVVPFTFHTSDRMNGDPWAYRAYLGPLDRTAAPARWPRNGS